MKIVYNKEILGSMRIFSQATGAILKDCFEIEDVMYFVVEPGQIGRAVGKKGENVKELQRKLNKKIRVIEYTPNLVEFVKNTIYPIKADSIEKRDGVVVLKSADRAKRAILIGRNAKNLNMVRDVAKRYFDIEDVRVE